ncbi:P-loop containing nucleoside triphosphate hydrolase protein [Mariannaea sp. PMI_226]|nr:P-loop containing nucleoside triphosphate hydrolase protein [Mariannaea sp. PMI_226]
MTTTTNIKRDPDSTTDVASPPDSRTNPVRGSSSVSNYGDSSSYLPLDRSFYRQGRSDAPTPSDRMTEPEPLLREMRMRPPTVANMAVESPASAEPTESFFHTSFQDIGKKLKACNDTLGELQQLGVSHDVQLPELVLVGDQSAGKSSLMSGLAHLELPRSEGTCTRCPLHIRVSRNPEWSCRVWLRTEYSYQPPPGRDITENDVTDQDPFFPWRKLPVSKTHEFKTMHEANEVEEVLRWAQIAILNDDKSHKLFIPGSGSIAMNTPIDRAAEEVTAKFSPNIVALEIKGPELPDLSFYDMPGIFQNPADARDDYLVSVVRNLSKDYIKHPSAIILCSMPMNSDAENSSTFGLCRKLGALNRTIGVLTKADLIPEGGNHDQWLSIMRGEAHQTGLGYFITSRPQGKDLEELRVWEEHIFEDHSLDRWPSAFHCFSERCGVEKLKAYLSERLGEEFAKSLPNIKLTLKQHLERIITQLGRLPELPKNVELEVQTSVMEFGELARSELKPAQFSRRFGSLPDDFRESLLEMKPKFILKDASDTPVMEISDDESDSESTVTTVNTPTSKRRSMAPPGTPAKRQRAELAANPSPVNGQHRNRQALPDDGRGSITPRPSPAPPQRRKEFPPPFTQFSNIGRGFGTLRQVRDEIRSKTRAGMPDIITEEVYNDLCKRAMAPWDGPMVAFLDQIMCLLYNMLIEALKKSFERLNKRLIYQESRKLLKEYLDDQRQETRDALEAVYRLETYGLFTINREAFNQCRKDEQVVLTRFRHHMRMVAAGYFDGRAQVPWESLTDEKRIQEEKKREAELVKIGPDPFEREVEVIAYVRGYYRLAALRFADMVALQVTNGMIPTIQRTLPHYLDEKLGLRGPDAGRVYERLMAEDQATATKRETLKGEREKFVRALASIEGLETGEDHGSSQMSMNEEHGNTDAMMSGAIQDEDTMEV